MRTLDYIFIIILVLIIIVILYKFNKKEKETFDSTLNATQLSVLTTLTPYLINIKNLSDMADTVISGKDTVLNGIHVTGDLIVDKNTIITAGTTLMSSLNVNGNSMLVGSLRGNSANLKNLHVSGISNLSGILKVSGISSLDSGFDSLNVNNNLSITGNTTIQGPTNIISNVNIIGDTTLGTIFVANRNPARNVINANNELIKINNDNKCLIFQIINNKSGVSMYLIHNLVDKNQRIGVASWNIWGGFANYDIDNLA